MFGLARISKTLELPKCFNDFIEVPTLTELKKVDFFSIFNEDRNIITLLVLLVLLYYQVT